MVSFTVVGISTWNSPLSSLPSPPTTILLSTQSPVALWGSQHHPCSLSPPWTLAALGAAAPVLVVTPWPCMMECLVLLRFHPSYLPALYISLLTSLLIFSHIRHTSCLRPQSIVSLSWILFPRHPPGSLCLLQDSALCSSSQSTLPPILFESAAKSLLCTPKSPDLNSVFPLKALIIYIKCIIYCQFPPIRTKRSFLMCKMLDGCQAHVEMQYLFTEFTYSLIHLLLASDGVLMLTSRVKMWRITVEDHLWQ